jgi:phage baseplate assembly protein W
MGIDYRIPKLKDVAEAESSKYLFKNAFDAGYRLPEQINEIIGFGSYVPLRQVKDFAGNDDIGMAAGFAKINSDIYMSLSTPYGVRFMNPEFGSKLHSLLFEPYDDFLLLRLRLYTVEALEKDIRKIKEVIVDVDTSQKEYHLLQLRIQYIIGNTNLTGNYVYPYIHEGESIRS